MHIVRTFAALYGAALIGCTGTEAGAGPDLDPSPVDIAARDNPVQTDATSYQLKRGAGEWRAYVTATYRNDGPGNVYFRRCNGGDTTPIFGVVRAGADSATPLFIDWGWACVGGVPTGAIAPGQSVMVRAPLGSVDQPNMQPPLRPEQMVGMARVVLELCAAPAADSDECVRLPLAQRQSNVFVIHY